MVPNKVDEVIDYLVKIRHMLITVGQSEGYHSMAENPYLIQLRDVAEKLNAKVNSENMTRFMHDLSLTVNNFRQFGAMASKMGNVYKKQSEYTLNSVEAFYLQSLEEGAMPSLNDMAEMFAMKYEKDGHLKVAPSIDGSAPQNDQDTP